MFEALQDGLGSARKTLRGQGKLSESNMRDGLKLVEKSLLIRQGGDLPLERAQSRSRNAELLTNRAGCRVFDFTMPWHGRAATIGRIAINGVAATFTIKDATMALEMANQFTTFHYTATSTDSVSQIVPLGASLSAFSRYDCNNNATAS